MNQVQKMALAVNDLLFPFLKGYASSGLAAGLAAVYCALTHASPEFAVLLVPVAASAGEWLERRALQAVALWRLRKAHSAGTAPGSVVDSSAHGAGTPSSTAAYETSITRYCGHDGAWHWSTTGCRTIGQAKGGGWMLAETLGGRVYNLDSDQWQ